VDFIVHLLAARGNQVCMSVTTSLFSQKKFVPNFLAANCTLVAGFMFIIVDSKRTSEYANSTLSKKTVFDAGNMNYGATIP
jgi:hypothetical protein